ELIGAARPALIHEDQIPLAPQSRQVAFARSANSVNRASARPAREVEDRIWSGPFAERGRHHNAQRNLPPGVRLPVFIDFVLPTAHIFSPAWQTTWFESQLLPRRSCSLGLS